MFVWTFWQCEFLYRFLMCGSSFSSFDCYLFWQLKLTRFVSMYIFVGIPHREHPGAKNFRSSKGAEDWPPSCGWGGTDHIQKDWNVTDPGLHPAGDWTCRGESCIKARERPPHAGFYHCRDYTILEGWKQFDTCTPLLWFQIQSICPPCLPILQRPLWNTARRLLGKYTLSNVQNSLGFYRFLNNATFSPKCLYLIRNA